MRRKLRCAARALAVESIGESARRSELFFLCLTFY